MKSYALQPTEENLLSSFKQDSIGRNGDLYNFVTFLNNIEDGCSVALEGYWGSGKTFFVKQTKKIIEAFNPFSNMDENERKLYVDYPIYNHSRVVFDENSLINQLPIYYDAWMNDNDEDPILSLVCTILEEFETDFMFKDIKLDSNALKDTVNTVLALTPLNVRIPEIIQSKDWLQQIKTNHEIHDTIEAFLDSLLAERGDRLVIFIDELDRCSPAYAVRFLERVKHYFNNDRITFVFSVNIQQLQHTIKNYYGRDFDAVRYLDRFFDFRLEIPKVDFMKFYDSIGIDHNKTWDSIVNTDAVNFFSFEMRDAAKFSLMMKMIQEKSVNSLKHTLGSNNEDLDWACVIFAPIMLGLKITNPDKYLDFINNDAEDVVKAFYSDNVSYQHLFAKFLEKDESYDIRFDDDHKQVGKTVDVPTVANRLYHAIFSKFKLGEFEKKIGTISISKDVKSELIERVSLISNSTHFDPKEVTEDKENEGE